MKKEWTEEAVRFKNEVAVAVMAAEKAGLSHNEISGILMHCAGFVMAHVEGIDELDPDDCAVVLSQNVSAGFDESRRAERRRLSVH